MTSGTCRTGQWQEGMAGYSGTPLPKKLGIKDGFAIALLNLPNDVKDQLHSALAQCRLAAADQPLDFVHLFVKTQAELRKEFRNWAKRLTAAGMLWVSWPKKTSGVATDLDENKVRQIGLDTGLVDVKVCAVSPVWSGLKFVIRLKDWTTQRVHAVTPTAQKTEKSSARPRRTRR